MTRKQKILKLLSRPHSHMTCGEICSFLIKDDNLSGNIAKYLSGSISSTLRKMVDKGELEYSQFTGPRGGHRYQKT